MYNRHPYAQHFGKKLTALFLLLCLLCMMLPASAAPTEGVLYASDFSTGAEGWYARGKSTELSLSDGKLVISGRTKKADGAAIDLDLQEGLLYSFTAEIAQDAKSSAEFALTVSHTKAGISSYTRLGTVRVSRGESVTVTGEWTAEPYDSYTFYVSSADNTTGDFCLTQVRILVSDPLYLSSASYEGELPSLKEVYAGKFDFGTCMSRIDANDRSRTALVRSQYSIITPENELKPDSVLDVTASKRLVKEQNDDTAVAVRFYNAVPILNFARNNGLKVHGHTLIWHSQTPEEFFHVGYDKSQPYVSREVMLGRLENYIRLIFEYMDQNYPGLFVSWDVANECVADGSTSLRSSNWTKVVGNDFVQRAFEYADKYAPEGVKLYYNDYSTPYEPKLTGIVNLLTKLAEEGHIDGYGFQSHYASDSPTVDAVRKAFERISALGLSLRVSELDITVKADTNITREEQAECYAGLMRLYLEYADILEAVQVWGVSDGTSWISEKHPLMFDANLQPKPAFFRVAELLN